MKRSIPIKVTALCLIVLLFFALRVHTFYLSHINNDELIYLGLSSKVDRFGYNVFDGHYNIYGLDLKIGQAFAGITPSDSNMGTLAQLLKVESGIETLQLSHHPPFYSVLLALSHRIFMPAHAYVVSWKRINTDALFLQWYACGIALLASLLMLFFVFLLGSALFSARIGLCASLLFVITPIDILTSQKIWCDDLVALCVLMSVFFYWRSLKRDSVTSAVASGICAGFAVLTKQSGILALPVVFILHYLFYSRPHTIGIKWIFEKRFLIFLFTFALCTIGWHMLFIRYNGWPLFWSQYIGGFSREGFYPSDFINFVNRRPWFTHLVTIPFQQPLFIFAFASFLFIKKDASYRRQLLFFLFWFLLFLLLATLKQGKEERYMLPAYPAICLLASYSFMKLWGTFSLRTGRAAVFLKHMLIILFVIAFVQALLIAIPAVIIRANLIPIPV